MTKEQLAMLLPYFKEGERYLNGKPVLWDEVNFETMQHVKRLREILDTPVRLIRGPHPDPDGTKPYKRTAIDACAPGAAMGQIAMTLCRFQGISFGIYSGNSFHIDTRDFDREPARWLAVKVAQEPSIKSSGLSELITSRADGWCYLSWSHPKSLKALQLVCALAEADAAGPPSGS